jgi:hypothetical protein
MSEPVVKRQRIEDAVAAAIAPEAKRAGDTALLTKLVDAKMMSALLPFVRFVDDFKSLARVSKTLQASLATEFGSQLVVKFPWPVLDIDTRDRGLFNNAVTFAAFCDSMRLGVRATYTLRMRNIGLLAEDESWLAPFVGMFERLQVLDITFGHSVLMRGALFRVSVADWRTLLQSSKLREIRLRTLEQARIPFSTVNNLQDALDTCSNTQVTRFESYMHLQPPSASTLRFPYRRTLRHLRMCWPSADALIHVRTLVDACPLLETLCLRWEHDSDMGFAGVVKAECLQRVGAAYASTLEELEWQVKSPGRFLAMIVDVDGLEALRPCTKLKRVSLSLVRVTDEQAMEFCRQHPLLQSFSCVGQTAWQSSTWMSACATHCPAMEVIDLLLSPRDVAAAADWVRWLKALPHIRKIPSFTLNNAMNDYTFLSHIAGAAPQLQQMHAVSILLPFHNMAPDILAALVKFTEMRVLWLDRIPSVDGKWLATLAKSMPHLEVLVLQTHHGIVSIDDSALVAFATHCPRLRTLYLRAEEAKNPVSILSSSSVLALLTGCEQLSILRLEIRGGGVQLPEDVRPALAALTRKRALHIRIHGFTGDMNDLCSQETYVMPWNSIAWENSSM